MMKKLTRRCKYMLLKFFRIRSSAHSISIGFALGASINFVPSFGMGLLMSIAFARIFKGNTVAAFLGGVSLVGVFPFLFYLNLKTGQFIYPPEIGEAIKDAASWHETVTAGFSVGRTFTIGMLINMVLFIFSLYPAIYLLFKHYQKQMLRLLYVKWVKRTTS